MLHRIHNQFGTAGMILSVVAIVLALAGGAIAANHGKPAPRGPRGKTGKTGATGPAGAPGTNGTNGAPGTKGDKGEKGDKGDKGDPGNSVVLGNIATGTPTCNEQGGTSVEVAGESASKKNVCNGKNGAIQPGETLPKGATETGTFAIYGGTGRIVQPISFPIQLSEALVYEPYEPTKNQVHYMVETSPGSGEYKEELEPGEPLVSQPKCPGSPKSPAAEEGNLCVYRFATAAHIEPVEAEFMAFSFVSGGILTFNGTGSPAIVSGTWAVTAE